MRTRGRREALLASSLLVLALSTSGTFGQSAPVYQFDIPAEKLSQALKDFSAASSQQILFSDDVIGDRNAPALHGSYTKDQALAALLRGSDLIADVSKTGVIMVRSKNVQAASNEAAGPGKKEIETVTVTGTRIPGTSPASTLIVLDRKYIETSGATTTGDVMRTMPQNFAGGQSPNVVGAGNGGFQNQNLTGASSPNLRGIGSGSTLTLVDGHRLSLDGFQGGADINAIPLIAADRIEVLSDGASAIYGADAIAGVVNVILRKDFDGVEARALYGVATDGGGEEQQYAIIGGKTWGNGNAVLSYTYNDTQKVLASQRDFSSSLFEPTDILPPSRKQSVFGSVNQDIVDGIDVFAEGIYTTQNNELIVSSPINATVQHENLRQYSITAGAHARLFDDWQLTGSATFNADHDHEVIDQVFFGTPFNTSDAYHDDGWNAEITATGTLLMLPWGPVAAALGVGHQFESFELVVPSFPTSDLSAHRNSDYGFAELNIPFVAHDTGRFLLNRLDVTLAGRAQCYSDFGCTTNPKVGLVYAPAPQFLVKASWGTSFRPPEFNQEFSPANALLRLLPAPQNGKADFLASLGGNPELRPETSRDVTASVEYLPESIPGLDLTVTLFKIDFSNRIGVPFPSISAAVGSLATQTQFPQFFTQNPTAAQQQAVINSALNFVNLTGGPYNPNNVAFIVDDSFHNISAVTTQGIDIQQLYATDLDGWHTTEFAVASVLGQRQTLVAGAPTKTISGTLFFPPRFRARAGATFSKGGLSLTAVVNHTSSESNTVSHTQARIGSWTTFDAQAAYTPELDGLLHGTSLKLSIQNLFDQAPPHVSADSFASPFNAGKGLGYDSTNSSPLGRFISVELVKSW